MSRKPNFDNDAAEDDGNVGSPPSRSSMNESKIALFIDFENIAIGVRDAHYRKFDINLVLERLLEKGKLLVKVAYADWSRYADYKRSYCIDDAFEKAVLKAAKATPVAGKKA